MDQNTIEITPYTSTDVGRTSLCLMLNTVCSAYSGLVPMSPNTTPRAPTVSTVLVPRLAGGPSLTSRRLGARAVDAGRPSGRLLGRWLFVTGASWHAEAAVHF